MGSAVFTMILLLLEPVGAIFDNVGASAHSTTVRFLNHVAYLTITYFSTTTRLVLAAKAGFGEKKRKGEKCYWR